VPDLATLSKVKFGSRVAEDESDNLESYFVETAQWSRIVAGEVDVVYGPKGSGKSAIHSLLIKRSNDFFDQKILLITAENPRGTAAFEGLKSDPPNSETEFVGMWKLYFVVLLADKLADFGVSNELSRQLLGILEEAGLRKGGLSLSAVVRAVVDYVRRVRTIETNLQIDPTSGIPSVGGKISLGEPSADERRAGVLSLDELLKLADDAWSQAGYRVWLLLDRLDVAFADTPELEENALRALFKTYLDSIPLVSIRFKIFLRSDIWQRLTAKGFREASHITRDVTIEWDEQSLLNLIVKRTLQNQVVRDKYGIKEDALPRTFVEQEHFFQLAFPMQIDLGERKSPTMGWILARTRDGTRVSAPREIIHLLNAARDAQIKNLEVGEEDAGEFLIGRSAFKEGLVEVSHARLEKTIYAEYPRLTRVISQLEGEKTAQGPETLAHIWNTSIDGARERAAELVEIGFFELRGTKSNPEYWVPFLYRDALHLVQGSASPQISGDD
jgi:hypothetical protein